MAKDSGGVTGLAGRYATALFELAVEENNLDKVAGDLGVLQGMLDDSADLRRLVKSPVLSREDQMRAMAAILAQADASDLALRFVGLLAERRRLFVIEAVIDKFTQLLAAHRGEIRAQVISARTLSDERLDHIRATLSKVLGGDVVIDAQTDEDMIGGLVVRVGSRMVDASIRSKIQRLQLAMKGIG